MAFHNVNYEVKTLTGTMTAGQLGDGITGATVHEIFCLTTGAITITPLKGDIFSWSATAGQSIKVMVKAITVSSGSFIGFKTQFSPPQAGVFNTKYLP